MNIENKSINDFLQSLKSRYRSYIKSGLKKILIVKVKSSFEISKYEDSFIKILHRQYIKFLSPSPPIDLIKNLLDQKVIELFLAFEEDAEPK